MPYKQFSRARSRSNKGGLKGSTGGGGRGFSTISQAGSRKMQEDTPGRDPRTHGNRRFAKGTPMGPGRRARVDHGVNRDSQGRPDGRANNRMAGQGGRYRNRTRTAMRPGLVKAEDDNRTIYRRALGGGKTQIRYGPLHELMPGRDVKKGRPSRRRYTGRQRPSGAGIYGG